MSSGAGAITADGRNVEMRQNQSDYSDEWILYGKRDYTLMYIGYQPGDPLMPAILNSVEDALNYAGMEGYAFTELSKYELMVYLSSCRIFSCITHGEQSSILTSNGNLSVSDISSLDSKAFDGIEFAYLGACLTGYGRGTADNLVNSIHDKGADTVLGFTMNVYVDETNFWTEKFMQSLATGKTIEEAMNYADDAIKNDSVLGGRNIYTVGEASRYIVGSTSIAPCD